MTPPPVVSGAHGDGGRMDDETLAELQRLSDEATPGPWASYDSNEGQWPPRPGWSVANDAFHNPPTDEDAPWLAVDLHVGVHADATLIAAMRNALPSLLRELGDTRARLAEAADEIHSVLFGRYVVQPIVGDRLVEIERDLRAALGAADQAGDGG